MGNLYLSEIYAIISDRMWGKVTVKKSFIQRIQHKGRGSVFSAKDFLNFGSRGAVDQALSRLARRGVIRRLDWGIYDYPKISRNLGVLSPDPIAVARAMARQTGSTIQVTGARAANTLGLTDQVPAKVVYLTDGPTRTVQVGNQTISLHHASKRNLVGAGQPSGIVFQALRYLGKDQVRDDTIVKLRQVLSPQQKKDLRRHVGRAPDWTREVIEQITGV